MTQQRPARLPTGLVNREPDSTSHSKRSQHRSASFPHRRSTCGHPLLASHVRGWKRDLLNQDQRKKSSARADILQIEYCMCRDIFRVCPVAFNVLNSLCDLFPSWSSRTETSALFSMSWFRLILSCSSSGNDFIENPDDGTLDERNLCHDVGNGHKCGEKEECDSDPG